MNQLTILPEYIMSFMQRQNIKKKNQNKLYNVDNSLKNEVKDEKKNENKEKKNKRIRKNKKKENEKNI